MAGAMEVERIETLKSFPIAEDVEKNPPGLLGRGTENGAGDLYSRVKSLERQLEFLEIRVRASEVQRRRDVDFRDVLIIRGGGVCFSLSLPYSARLRLDALGREESVVGIVRVVGDATDGAASREAFPTGPPGLLRPAMLLPHCPHHALTMPSLTSHFRKNT